MTVYNLEDRLPEHYEHGGKTVGEVLETHESYILFLHAEPNVDFELHCDIIRDLKEKRGILSGYGRHTIANFRSK